ncbi:uncharacterized protein LOC128224926 [Mya arenaria]|uniref:uncharacterized protein LOC128224926 n=1 Tax=Mya arenaria TaxID=6604 RepID=UPI0022E438F8|nr:uncharacterized protein LOC128224926 [Mya arenaria]
MLDGRIVCLFKLVILLWNAAATESSSVSDELAKLNKVVGDILKNQHDRESRIERLEEEMKRLNEKLESQTEKLDRQDDVMKQQKSEIQQQKARIEVLTHTIDELVTINEHSNDEGTPNDETVVLSGQPNEHQVVKQLVRRGVKLVRQVELGTAVAFLATMGSHNVHSGQNQPLIFERVVTDIGNAYNPHIGTFIAPVDGVYSFSVTLLSASGFISHYYIYKNNTAICHLTLYHPSSETYTSMSQTAVLQLKKGEDVSIRNLDADKTTYGDNYSTFSGFILWETYAHPEIVGKK